MRAEQGAPDDAITHYERALAIRELTGAPPSAVAATRFDLACALWDGHGDRSRARELATNAADTERARGADGAKALAEIEAWLGTHATAG